MATKTSKEETFFLVNFRDPKEGKNMAIKVRKIEDSSLGLGFIKISDFIFDTQSRVVQPSEEQAQKRFENVKSLHLSIYNIISIEELGLQHVGLKFRKDRSNLIAFPSETAPLK